MVNRLEQAWAYLRAAGASPPSDRAFMAICSLIDRWPDPASAAVAMDYAANAVAGWEPRYCAEVATAEQLPMIAGCPSFALVRQLNATVAQLPRNDGALRQLRLEKLSHLTVSGDPTNVSAFLHAADLPGLRSLRVGWLSIELVEQLPSVVQRLQEVTVEDFESPEAARAFWDLIRKTGIRRLEIHASALADICPAAWPQSLAAVCVHGADASCIEMMASSAHLPSLLHLRNLDVRAAPYLAKLPPTASVRSLSIAPSVEGDSNDPSTLLGLFGYNCAHRLRELEIHDLGMPDEFWHALRQQPLAELEDLRLVNVPVSLRAMELLAETALPALSRLAISRGGLCDDAVGCLSHARRWGRLGALDLSMNPITDKSISAIAGAEVTDNLACLNMGGTKLTACGVAALSQSTSVGALRELCVGGNQLGPEVGSILAASSLPQTVELLAIDYASLGDRGLSSLLRGQPWPRLHGFMAGGNEISPAAVEAAVNCRVFSSLWSLRLSMNPLGDEGAFALARSQWTTGVVDLDISFAGISVRGLGAILSGPMAHHLRQVCCEAVEDQCLLREFNGSDLLPVLRAALGPTRTT